MKVTSEEEVLNSCLKYFNNDKLAASTFLSKYSMRDKNSFEENPDDMHHRLAKEYARIEKRFGGEHQLSEDEIYNLFEHFKYIVPGGSVMSGLGNPNYIGSLSNCFVAGQPEDSYASIMKYRDYQVELMKRRGGVGIDLSKLRPDNTPVKNAAGTSSGPVSFMHVTSELTKEVALNGRRGALMISISGDHPDVEQFIECKQDLTKITGANISVKFSDDFMKAVENNEDYYLHWPIDKPLAFSAPFEYNVKYWSEDGKQCGMKVHARDIWNKFVHCAWNTAEPGIMYEDKHHNLSPDGVYEQYKGVTTNPCVAGETIVITDKGEITIKEITERFNNGEKFKALSVNLNTNEYSFQNITNALLTKHDAEVVTLYNDNIYNNKLDVTLNHKVCTQNNTYVNVEDLEKNSMFLRTIFGKYNGFYYINGGKNNTHTCDVYDITVENNHNFFANGILVHNCGEIFMEPGDSCRLMHINLVSFVKEDKSFDYNLLEQVAYKNMQLCDDLVELELEHVQRIIDHIKETYTDDCRNELELWQKIYETGKSSRRAGCGATGVADTIALMGIKLNSEEGFNTIEKIFQTKMLGELKAQINLAKERGTFTGYKFEKEYTIKHTVKCLPWMGLHNYYRGCNDFFEKLLDLPNLTKEMIEQMHQFGRRNVSWSTMAPVGTGAIMTQGTSGIEPLFMPYYKRRKKCMSKDDRVDFIDKTGEKFTEFLVVHKPLENWIINNCKDYDNTKTFEEQTTEEKLERWFKLSPWYECTAADLTPIEHCHLQSIVNQYITHSISKTVNLPNTATEQEISDLYMQGWKQNCKGLTVYRDGCRDGILVKSNENKDCNCKCNNTLTHSAPKRPKSLPCDVKRFRNGGEKWVACVGLYQGQPYEIFTGLADKLNLPENIDKCAIIKNKVDKEVYNDEIGKNEIQKVSSYDLMYSDKDGNLQMIENIGGIFRSEFYNVSKMTSGLLRHGMPIDYIISLIKSLDFKNDTINSWKSGVMRALKSYIKDGEVTGEVCPECGGKVVRENGCKHCINCGWSACQ